MANKTSKFDPATYTEALSANVLKDMVNELEETKLKLLLNIKELKEKLEQQKSDHTDIYYYLNKKCDESFEVIASLEEQIMSEQTDREIAEKLYESKIDELKSSLESNETKYKSKIIDLENKLEMLNTFSQQKEEADKNAADLTRQLQESKEENQRNLEEMENRFVIEREKLRKSYDQKFENTRRELESTLENKLSSKSKKTQILNILMKKELGDQSKHAEKLIEINKKVIDRDREIKIELDIAKSLQKEMADKLSMYQRNNKKLTEEANKKSIEIETQREKLEELLADKEKVILELEKKLNFSQKKFQLENKKLDEMWKFLSDSYNVLRSKNKLGADMDLENQRSILKQQEEFSHEKLLVNLIQDVLYRYPEILSSDLLQASITSPRQVNNESETKSPESKNFWTNKEASRVGSLPLDKFRQREKKFLRRAITKEIGTQVTEYQIFASIRPNEMPSIDDFSTNQSLASNSIANASHDESQSLAMYSVPSMWGKDQKIPHYTPIPPSNATGLNGDGQYMGDISSSKSYSGVNSEHAKKKPKSSRHIIHKKSKSTSSRLKKRDQHTQQWIQENSRNSNLPTNEFFNLEINNIKHHDKEILSPRIPDFERKYQLSNINQNYFIESRSLNKIENSVFEDISISGHSLVHLPKI